MQLIRNTCTTWIRFRLVLLTLITSTLTACGNGDYTDGLRTYPKLTISGTAMIGRPIANAPITLKCIGSQTDKSYTYFATTDANGTYNKRVDAATAPCIISVDYQDSNGNTQTLSSYVKTLSTDSRTNITPLTHAILFAMMDKLTVDALAANQNFLLKLNDALQKDKDTTAWTELKKNLKRWYNIDTSSITGEPVTSTLDVDAAHNGTGYDKLLTDISAISIEILNQLATVRFESTNTASDAEVQDTWTTLIWQRCVVGMIWNGSTCTGSPLMLSWSDLPQLIANNTSTSASRLWRLPTYDELVTLHSSGINALPPYVEDENWFPSTPADWTWTSTPPSYTTPTAVAKIVGFQLPSPGGYFGENTDYLIVRLVR